MAVHRTLIEFLAHAPTPKPKLARSLDLLAEIAERPNRAVELQAILATALTAALERVAQTAPTGLRAASVVAATANTARAQRTPGLDLANRQLQQAIPLVAEGLTSAITRSPEFVSRLTTDPKGAVEAFERALTGAFQVSDVRASIRQQSPVPRRKHSASRRKAPEIDLGDPLAAEVKRLLDTTKEARPSLDRLPPAARSIILLWNQAVAGFGGRSKSREAKAEARKRMAARNKNKAAELAAARIAAAKRKTLLG